MKKTVTTLTKWMVSALFALLLVFAVAPDAQLQAADIPAVTNVKQVKYNTNAIEITFDASLDNTVYYSIQLLDPSTNTYIEYAYENVGSADIYGLPNAGTSYTLRVVPYRRISGTFGNNTNAKDSYMHDEGTPSAPIEVVTCPNDKPATLTHTSSTETSISLAWSPVNGANAYAIAYAPSGVTDPAIVYTTATTYTLSNLGKDTKYHIEVTAVRNSAAGFSAISSSYASLYTVPVAPSKASKPVLEYWWNSSSELEATTQALTCADGYEYQVNTYKNKKATTFTTTSSTTAAFIKYKNFKKYQFFKIRVRGFCKTSDGSKCYGSWSDWQYICSAPVVKGKSSGTKLKASWSKVTGASRYVVYVSNKKDSGYKKFTTTKKTSCTITKFGKQKLKKNKTYYVSVVPQIKVGKKYISGMPQNYYVYQYKCK